MERHLQLTQDGSHTIAIPSMQVTYHSMHGAVQESMHVFIHLGLHPLLGLYPELRIFEMGFGTGLNALLTLQQVVAQRQQVYYETVERYPLSIGEAHSLNYNVLLKDDQAPAWQEALHAAPWDQQVMIDPLFAFCKKQLSLSQYLEIPPQQAFHLVYFDAFDPSSQPELWSQAVFAQLFARMHNGGVLVTYCSKGIVRRAMQAAGFTVEKLSGPPGKREIVRARKGGS